MALAVFIGKTRLIDNARLWSAKTVRLPMLYISCIWHMKQFDFLVLGSESQGCRSH